MKPRPKRRKQTHTLTVLPPKTYPLGRLLIRGTGWPDCPVEISLDKRPVRDAVHALGLPHPDGVLPDATGAFALVVDIFGLMPGKHEVVARSRHRQGGLRASQRILVEELRPSVGDQEPGTEDQLRHAPHLAGRRFGHLGYFPPEARSVQIASVRHLRARAYGAREIASSPRSGSLEP
jgi:hypothetical protein